MGEQTGAGGSRRRFQRISFDAPATISGGPGDWTGRVVDISLRGALLELPADWRGEVGDHFELGITLDEGTAILMEVVLVHREGSHAGFRCEGSDVESMSHLRRLVELNLGDVSLLERELSALSTEE